MTGRRGRVAIAVLSSFLIKEMPFLFSFFLLLVGLFPTRFYFLNHFPVMLVYIPLFLGAIFCPIQLSPLRVFLLGFFADLLFNLPLGFYTVLFLLFYWAVFLERRFLNNRSFLFLWGAFCVFLVPLCIVSWGLASLLSWHYFSFSAVVVQMFLLGCFFPFIEVMCAVYYERYLA